MPFLTEEEILSQPDCWQRAVDMAEGVRGRWPEPGARVAFVGTGTAWFMAEAMAALRERLGQGESDAFVASEFPPLRRYDHVVLMTRSGRTTDINKLLRRLRGQMPTLAIVGDMQAESAELADASIDLSFADEASVVQTRFATTALALCRALLVGEKAHADLERWLTDADYALAIRLDDDYADVDQITYLGRDWTIPLAAEAASKVRQCSQGWAEAYSALEYRHGPITIAEPGRLVWMIGDAPVGLDEDVEATGATWVNHGIDPMAELIVAQRLAVGRAMRLGLNPDTPRHRTRTVVHRG